MMRVFGYGLLLAVAPVASVAQTAATGTVIGIVTDPNGAAVPGAQLTLREANAGSGRQTESNAEGQFVYTSVLPGTYRLTAFKQGFRPLIAEDIRVEVAKSSNVEIALQVGVIAEAITVTPGASVELQTLDATVGAVLKGEPALRVPTINRSAGALFAIQPLVAPSPGARIACQSRPSGRCALRSECLSPGWCRRYGYGRRFGHLRSGSD